MAKINVIVAEITTEGTRHSNSLAVPVGAKSVRVMMPRKDMLDDKIAFACQLFLSLDDGKSWRPWGGAGTVGGVVIDSATGITATESGMEMTLPEPTNSKRRIKTTVSISNEAKIGLDVEFK
ncbi:hypothetical protein ES705_45789 [subsurface metagenome]